MFENATEQLESIIQVRKAEEAGGATPDSNGNPDILQLAEEITGLLDAGNITADTEKVSAWAQSKGLSAENAMDFASSVIDAYLGEDEEGEEEGEGEEEDHAEPDADNMGGESDNDEDNEDEETMKSGIKYLESLEATINALGEQLAEIQKSNSILAAGLHSLIESGEKQSEEMTLLKSKLGIISATPVNPKNPVLSTNEVPVQKSSFADMPRNDIKQIILKGSLAGKIKLEEVQLWETTGKITQNIENLIKESGK